MNEERYKHYLKKFGQNLRRIRKEQGLSMETLSYKADIEYRQLGRIERGEINTSIITSLRLAETLQIEVAKLFIFDEYTP